MSTSFEEQTKTEKTCFLFVFRCFFLISNVKSLKKVEDEQKSLKTAEKSSSTSFRVDAAPESWSKYTTNLSIKKTFKCYELKMKKLWHHVYFPNEPSPSTGSLTYRFPDQCRNEKMDWSGNLYNNNNNNNNNNHLFS